MFISNNIKEDIFILQSWGRKIIILINISLTEIIPTEYQNLAGDINQDGTIDILDIINCINIILNR